MDACPISLEPLEVIGYADVLPDGRGPAVRPPVFRDRTQPARCYLPPFRLVGGWVSGAQAITRAEVDALAQAGELTLFSGTPFPAQPDSWLWVDAAGVVHYEPVATAREKLKAFSLEQQAAARAALQTGNLPDAERAAGMAVASDGAVEARALQAVGYALRGKDAQLAFLRKSAGQAGFQAATFNLLVQRELEALPWEAWQHFDLASANRACQSNGISFSVEFPIRADVRPFVSDVVHHQPVWRGITIRCQGPDAQFLGTFLHLLEDEEVQGLAQGQAVEAVRNLFWFNQPRDSRTAIPARDSLQDYFGQLRQSLVRRHTLWEDEPLVVSQTNATVGSSTPLRSVAV